MPRGGGASVPLESYATWTGEAATCSSAIGEFAAEPGGAQSTLNASAGKKEGAAVRTQYHAALVRSQRECMRSGPRCCSAQPRSGDEQTYLPH